MVRYSTERSALGAANSAETRTSSVSDLTTSFHSTHYEKMAQIFPANLSSVSISYDCTDLSAPVSQINDGHEKKHKRPA